MTYRQYDLSKNKKIAMFNKAQQAIDEYQRRFEYWLTDQSILPGYQGYEKFVIVCGIRTGSTMLCSLLSSHPQTLTFFELFHRYLGSTPFNAPGYRSKCKEQRIIELRNLDPVAFIESEVYKLLPKRIKAVGFKLLYTQARNNDPWWNASEFDRWWKDVGHPPKLVSAKSDLWAYLKERSDIAIIHIRRENLLRRIISTAIAQQTGNWGIGATGGVGGSHKPLPQFELDFSNCLQDFEAIRRMEDEADEFFADHRKLVLSYERLVEDTELTTNTIQDFLHLQIQPLATKTRKQVRSSLSEIVVNYGELKKQFLNTPYIDFFDD